MSFPAPGRRDGVRRAATGLRAGALRCSAEVSRQSPCGGLRLLREGIAPSDPSPLAPPHPGRLRSRREAAPGTAVGRIHLPAGPGLCDAGNYVEITVTVYAISPHIVATLYYRLNCHRKSQNNWISCKAEPYSPTSFSLNFAQSSGTQSIRSSMPYLSARLVIWSTPPPVRNKSASSAKYFSKPAGEMSSSNLAGFVVAFQKVCGRPPGLST